MIGTIVWATQRLTGGTLILGCVLLLAGAAGYMYVRDKHGPMIFGQPPREWLRLIAGHPHPWRWSTILFIAGTLLTLVGQLGLTVLLRTAGDPGFALLALLATAIGAVLWTINLAARLTVDPWASVELARTGAVPDLFEPVSRWTGVLFVIYTILTFAGLMAFGAALALTPLLPSWVGWTAITYGAAGLGLLAATRDAPPFLHYLMPLLIGVLLLAR